MPVGSVGDPLPPSPQPARRATSPIAPVRSSAMRFARDKPTMRDGAMSSRLACGIAVPRVRWRIEQVLVQLEIEPTPELESGMANHAAGLEPELQVQGPARVVGRLDAGDH